VNPKLIESYLTQTKVLKQPRRLLSTFGSTQIEYHLISPVEDLEDRTRLRQGTVVSDRPKILTADAFLDRFQGFGEEAGDFERFLSGAYRDLLRALEYNFKNQGFSTRVLSEKPAVVAERIAGELDDRQALISCPDGAWSLALMKFTLDESARSFPTNVQDLERRNLFPKPPQA
jgi:hypothetical protein